MLRGLPARRKAGTAARLLRTAVSHRFAPAGKRASTACQICTPHTSVLTTETTRPSHPAPIARRSAKTMMQISTQKNGSKLPARAGGGECGGIGCGCGCDGIGGDGRGGSDGAGDQCAPATHAARIKLEVGVDPAQGWALRPEVRSEPRKNPSQSTAELRVVALLPFSQPAPHLRWRPASA